MNNTSLSVQTSIISPKYQIVIPRLTRKRLGWVRPGRKVAVEPLWGQSVRIKPLPTKVTPRWSQLAYGLDKRIWKSVNIKEYIRNLRSEE